MQPQGWQRTARVRSNLKVTGGQGFKRWEEKGRHGESWAGGHSVGHTGWRREAAGRRGQRQNGNQGRVLRVGRCWLPRLLGKQQESSGQPIAYKLQIK